VPLVDYAERWVVERRLQPRTRELYGRTRAALGTEEFDQAWRESEYLSIGDLTSMDLTSRT